MKTDKPLVVANWKMNKTINDTNVFLKTMSALVNEKEKDHFVFFPPALSAYPFSQQATFGWGVQNINEHISGAFTGENSVDMALELGADYILIGHSERRSLFAETDDMVNKKVHLALEKNLTPLICVGEHLEQRQQNKFTEVIKEQILASLKGLEESHAFVIAYEPVWAIGTGQVATAKQAQEVHQFIRSLLSERFSPEKAKDTKILYGGSVKAQNSKELFSEPDIDGFLVGGASLDPTSFYSIYSEI